MYLNLDLLYNVDMYLLFYYKNDSCPYTFFIYSPVYKKSVYKSNYNHEYYYYCDHITNLYKRRNTINSFYYDINDILSESYTKCKPFFLEKKYIEYLKSNERITENVS